jgi:hypothetical protein
VSDGARDRYQGISADFLSQPETGSRGFDERPGQILAVREGDAVDHDIDASGAGRDALGELRQFLVLGDVARKNVFSGKFPAQSLDRVPLPLTLVGQDEVGALTPERLGDRIGQTPAIGDPKNERTLPL